MTEPATAATEVRLQRAMCEDTAPIGLAASLTCDQEDGHAEDHHDARWRVYWRTDGT